MVSIGALNALPAGVREQLYLRLIPGDLIDRFGVDPATLRGPAGDRLVRITAAEDKTWARIELRHREQDRDPVLLLDVGMRSEERRVGKECRCREMPDRSIKKRESIRCTVLRL